MVFRIQKLSKWIGIAALLLCGGCLYEPVPEGMVLIPGGEFTMGTDLVDKKQHALSVGLTKPWFADETPESRVPVRGFFIDRYEVTNHQYYIFCQATSHRTPAIWGSPKYPEGQGDLPVSYVSYFDASHYAEWAGKRLPTEAEWEKAARGPLGNRYPWGNEFRADAANLSPSAKKKTGHGLKPVGSFPQGQSHYGVHDMIGNVWEWVWDYYRPYEGSAHQSEDYEKKFIVVRGLSYLSVGHFRGKDYKRVLALKARAGFREKLFPLARKKDVGFRCAKDRRPLFREKPRPEKKLT